MPNKKASKTVRVKAWSAISPKGNLCQWAVATKREARENIGEWNYSRATLEMFDWEVVRVTITYPKPR